MADSEKDIPVAEEAAPEQQPETAAEPKASEATETDSGKKGKKKKEPKPSPEEKLKAELAQEHDKYVRALAEYDNYRKRSQKERTALYAEVQSDTVKRFLPVYDNLARALRQESGDEAFKKGVEMTMTQLQEILDKLGVKEIEAVGQHFDPNRHNAVMHCEDPSVGESVVVEEFEKGFQLGDKVIRFSMVKVAN